MIQTGIKVSKINNFIKNNLSIIVIIPAFIGGLWQSIELMSISTPFIRFFSISQIIPDGILILLFFLTAFLPVFIVYYFEHFKAFASMENTIERVNLEPIDIEKESKGNVILYACIFVFFYVIDVFILYIGFKSKNVFDEVSSFIFMNGATVFICNVFLNKCYLNSNEKFQKIFKKANILLVILYIWIAVALCNRIHNSFLITDNFENIKNIKCILNKKYPTSQKEILYFNDKYLFVKIIDKVLIGKKMQSIEKIYILQLENLFNE